MRDAFGGAFMIKLFLVFIFVYICFTAIALNYAKAFKVKNKVIDYLENNEIPSLDDMTAFDEAELEQFLETEIFSKMNYKVNIDNICSGIDEEEEGERVAYCSDLGIVIRESGRAENTKGVYYTVSTYVGWSTGFLKPLSSLNGNNSEQDAVAGTWRISGETRLIVNE